MLFAQTFVDQNRLIDNIRAALPEHSAALLSDIVSLYPLEQGAAEIVGYLALDDGDVAVEMDDSDETAIDHDDPADPTNVRRGGYRASIAASVLAARGIPVVAVDDSFADSARAPGLRVA